MYNNYDAQESFERHFEMEHSQRVLLLDVYFSRPQNRVVGIQKLSNYKSAKMIVLFHHIVLFYTIDVFG